MKNSRRLFLKSVFGSAAFLTISRTQFLDEILGQEKQKKIKGAGVKEGIVMLKWNENPLGPSPMAIEEVIKGLSASNRYHRPQQIERTIAKHHNIEPKFITKGVGATEILYNVPISFLSEKDNMIMADPSYNTTGRIASLLGAEVRRIPLTKNLEHDLDAFLSAIDRKTKFIMICNPNNPTGTITPAKKIKKFLDKVPENILVMIDEAYFHFAENPEYESFYKYPVEGRNVIVVRTFSKVYGLAGLRIGYAIANEKITKKIREVNLRGLTNLVAHYAVPAALKDYEHIERTKKITKIGKNYFYKEFSAMGYNVPKSETNHIFVDLKRKTDPLIDELKKKKIFVRNGSDWNKPTCMRISIGTMEENRAFMKALKSLL
ncbi:histidinol-phosphate transaminase [candidate division KSB1 bacterium]|nr:MAG: histidinol-phosphate transaminase [candidate division KSB1 bacterium]